MRIYRVNSQNLTKQNQSPLIHCNSNSSNGGYGTLPPDPTHQLNRHRLHPRGLHPLSQLQLHHPPLRSPRWIPIALHHEVPLRHFQLPHPMSQGQHQRPQLQPLPLIPRRPPIARRDWLWIPRQRQNHRPNQLFYYRSFVRHFICNHFIICMVYEFRVCCIAGIENKEEIHDHEFYFSDGFHQYVIKWIPELIEWLIDGRSVRRVERKPGERFPEKPMYLYVSIWNACNIVRPFPR